MATFEIHHGDNRDVLKTLADNSVDSVVTDPPYELGFMGKSWDASGIAYSVELWQEVLRVLKPGGHLLAFSGSRTYHRMVVAIEDAGFEIRDQIMWIYGSGFPKSLDIAKAMDKSLGLQGEKIGERTFGKTSTGQGAGWNENAVAATGKQDVFAPASPNAKQWQGWGTALKPAHEPVVVARKPLIGTVAANVLTYGTGGLNIDASRVGRARVTSGQTQSGEVQLHADSDELVQRVALVRGVGDHDLRRQRIITGQSRDTERLVTEEERGNDVLAGPKTTTSGGRLINELITSSTGTGADE